jgi:hypothetical protein
MSTINQELAVIPEHGIQPSNIIEAVQQRIVTGDLPIEVLERLLALRDKELARNAEMDFNDAMNACQAEIKQVVPDEETADKKWKWASHVALDKAIRPIYLRHGLSLSFDEGEFLGPDMVQVVCYVSHKSGHTRKYHKNIPADGKGAKGGDVMTKADAVGAADTRGIRYLIKKIFNIPVGDDEDAGPINNGWLSEKIAGFKKCVDQQYLQKLFTEAFNEAKHHKAAKAMLLLVEARDKRKAELG